MYPPKQLEPGKARWKFDPEMWNSELIVVEPKLDGTRYLLQCNIGGNWFTSRHISKKTGQFVEKCENIPHLRDVFVNLGLDVSLEGCVFDGEIVAPDNLHSKSMDVTKVMGSLPFRAVEEQQKTGWLDYYIFDILFDKNGKDIRHLSYKDRRAILLDYLEDVADPKRHLKIIPSETENKEKFYLDIIDSGGEGVILKDINAPYGKNWSKCKKTATWDVIITGFKNAKEITKKVSGEESISKFAEKKWIGAIEFGQYLIDGTLMEFGFCSGMDDALREKISNNREYYIGKVMEIGAQERLVSGRFRHPRFLRFRPDKNPCDCTYRPNES